MKVKLQSAICTPLDSNYQIGRKTKKKDNSLEHYNLISIPTKSYKNCIQGTHNYTVSCVIKDVRVKKT